MPDLTDYAEMFDTGFPLPAEEPVGDSDEDLQSLVRRQIADAIHWREENLDPIQEKATDYYMGRPYDGDDKIEGRSRVVTTEVRDAVQGMLPSLMRVFVGSERVVEFKPRGPEDEELTQQQTEYVNYIVLEDNPGFLTLFSAFKDALVRKVGVVMWWWEDKEEVLGSEHTGLTAEQIAVLRAEPNMVVELDDPDEEDMLLEARSELFDVTVQRVRNDGRVRIEAVPPEEFLFSPSARCLDDARMVGRVREMRADELVALGIPEDVVERNVGKSDVDRSEQLRAARRVDGGAHQHFEDEQPDSTRPVRFAEIYTRVDLNGDGKAELRKVWAIGEACEIVNGDGKGVIVDSVPFALFEPDPEPHTMIGLCPADYLMDLQRVNSVITRGMLDSLSLSLNPSTEVVEGEVNVKDLLNPEVGRLVRVKRPGMMREIVTPFIGSEALPVLEHMRELGTKRVGRSDASDGLDPDSLQSATRAAVAATISAGQQRLELIARIFAETGMKQLMRGVLRTVVQHQEETRVVRLRNEYVRVDPRAWDADKDVVVNVALGTGLVEEKVEMLRMIVEEQKLHIAQGSPLGSFAKLRAAYGRITDLLGFRNSEEFFPAFTPEQEQQLRDQQAANQKPPIEEVLAQIELEKVRARERETQAKNEIEMLKLQVELAVKQAEINLKAQQGEIDADLEAARLELDASVKAVEAARTLSQTQVGASDG